MSLSKEDLRKGCAGRVYEEIGRERAMDLAREGKMVSSSFVVCRVEGKEGNERFILNFHHQSKHWRKERVKMETTP